MYYLKTKSAKIYYNNVYLELVRLIYKFIIINFFLPFISRQHACLSLLNLIQQSSLSYLHTRCMFNGRGKWIIQLLGVDRFQLRVALCLAQLMGVRRSS